jgi:sulfofructose kinase
MKSIKYDCVGQGIIVFDELAVLENFPLPNSKNTLRAYFQQGGGPVPTALATLAKLGKTSALVTVVGQDHQGRFLCRELKQFGIETSFIKHMNSLATPRAIILVDQSTGERTVLLERDPACTIEDRIEEKQHPFDCCRILHLDGHFPKVDIQAAQIAKEHGALISMDIGSDRYISPALLELVDIAIVSEAYSQHYLVADNPVKSVEKLSKAGVALAGVTCGTMGSYFCNGKELVRQPAFKVTTIDSTGAGDVFHGAALFGVLQGFTIGQIALFASAAAALKCRQIGGKTGIPNLEQIKLFLTQTGSNADFIS